MEYSMIHISKATSNDLKEIAKIHKQVYTSSHFTSLFPLQLLEDFYGYFIEGDSSILLARNDSNELQGFIVSGTDISSRLQRFKREQKFAIWKTAFAHPLVAVKKTVRQLYYKFSRHDEVHEANNLILSIAVAVQRQGIGGILLDEIFKTSSDKYIGLYVRVTNTIALNLYLKHHFKIIAYTSGQYYMEKENKRANSIS